MDNVLNYLTLNILMTNQYIDANEKQGNPIKTVLKNFYATAKSDLSLHYELRIGENYLTQSTNSLSNLLGQQNLTYYTIRDDSMQIGVNNMSDNLITCQILLDDVVTSTKLELFTLSDALSNTGGIIGIITIVAQVLVSNLQEYLYYQSMIKQQFQITSDLLVKQHQNVRIEQNQGNQGLPSTLKDQNIQKVTTLESLINDLKK
ncbi:UNKNOWN [Stylonychia lemnae]|uniref:Uncharacterized protein n=1 Tax=Stylonychia lemnae TaxID=5949 RepID=A0A078B662_STYLE|nr:UNKNOWN [Stylonychia lemnae]|eukprot:CDW89716.1 UNKNOWN [Stylonychia lemnae]